MKHCVVFIIRVYQRFLAGFHFRACRFYPSCSQYWIEALEKHGLLKGIVKGTWRLLRCHPLSAGGYDSP